MANLREKVHEFLEEYLKKHPPEAGQGRRTIYMPEPQPEDERERYKTEGPVPEGFVRAECCRPNRYEGDKLYRLGSFWATVKHQDKPERAERLFSGDIVDIPEKEFAKFYEKQWVRQPWTPPKENVKKPQAA